MKPFKNLLSLTIDRKSNGISKIKIEQSDIYNIGHAASICLSRAIARGVYEATPSKNDTLPTWKEVENKRL